MKIRPLAPPDSLHLLSAQGWLELGNCLEATPAPQVEYSDGSAMTTSPTRSVSLSPSQNPPAGGPRPAPGISRTLAHARASSRILTHAHAFSRIQFFVDEGPP